jgi:hypothetical protein
MIVCGVTQQTCRGWRGACSQHVFEPPVRARHRQKIPATLCVGSLQHWRLIVRFGARPRFGMPRSNQWSNQPTVAMRQQVSRRK